MAVKIGGFAAFMITVAIAAAAERIVHCVVNRPQPKRKSEPQAAFWNALGTAITEVRTGPDQHDEFSFRTTVLAKVGGLYDAAVVDARDRRELEEFLALLQSKWEAIDKAV